MILGTIFFAAFALSLVPDATLPGLKKERLIFWSFLPVVCENL